MKKIKLHISLYIILMMAIFVSHVIRNWYNEAKVIAILEMNGAIISYDGNTLLSPIFKHAIDVTFNNKKPDNTSLLMLYDLPYLRYLNFYGASLQDNQLRIVTGLNLTCLRIENYELSNDEGGLIAKMNKLDHLFLNNVKNSQVVDGKLPKVKITINENRSNNSESMKVIVDAISNDEIVINFKQARKQYGFPPKIDDFIQEVSPPNKSEEEEKYSFCLNESAESYIGGDEFNKLDKYFSKIPFIKNVDWDDRAIFRFDSAEHDLYKIKKALYLQFLAACIKEDTRRFNSPIKWEE